MSAKGYEIKISDGTVFQIVTRDNSKLCIASIDNVTVEIENGQVSLVIDSGPRSDLMVSDIKDCAFELAQMAENPTSTEINGVRKTCIVCNGKKYCVTNGTSIAPCGAVTD